MSHTLLCTRPITDTVEPVLSGHVSKSRIQTTYCIQFQSMQFHMIRSFFSSSMCIKLCVFTHSSFKSDNEFLRTTIHKQDHRTENKRAV